MAINILTELNNDFLVYAQEVNNSRAFCDARDGLKPVQRRILYSMNKEHNTYDKGYYNLQVNYTLDSNIMNYQTINKKILIK